MVSVMMVVQVQSILCALKAQIALTVVKVQAVQIDRAVVIVWPAHASLVAVVELLVLTALGAVIHPAVQIPQVYCH